MNLNPFNQTKLYGLDIFFEELKSLADNERLPTKILFTGYKGCGKCTLALHLINYILSKNEEFKYDILNNQIDENNKSYKLILNSSSPNFYYINLKKDKKSIDVNQIRELINFCNKSSFNNLPRFILIDNSEFLNLNSSNALLKILEEPNEGIFFILINNSNNILPTIKSRCLNYRINLSNDQTLNIVNNLINDDIFKFVDKDLLNYYFSAGDILNIYNFSIEYKLDFSEMNISNLIQIIIKDKIYKKDTQLKELIWNFIEIFFSKKGYSLNNYKNYLDHINLVENTKKFNLDIDSVFVKLQTNYTNE